MNQSVTIVLATYQGAAHLAAQLDSLRQQTCWDWTLLVRDDGSRDGTLELLQAHAQQDARIQLLQDAAGNLGPTANFSLLLATARDRGARYAFLADQDDHWHPEKLDRQLAQLRQAEKRWGEHLPLLAHSDLRLIDAQGRLISRSFKRYQALPRDPLAPLPILLASNFVTGCTVGINRALLELAVPIPQPVAMHDWWLALLAAATGRMLYRDLALVDYRQHGGNCLGGRRGWHSVRRVWRRLRQAPSGQGDFALSLAQVETLSAYLRARGRGDPASPQLRLITDYARLWQTPMPWPQRLAQVRRLGVRRAPWLRTALFYLEVIRWRPVVLTSPAPHLLLSVAEDWFFWSHFRDRAQAAAAAGYRVTLVTRIRAHGARIRALGIHLVGIEIDRHGLNPLVELPTLARLWRIYARARPDLMHQVALKPIVYGTLVARLLGLPAPINAPVGMGFVFTSTTRRARWLRPLLRLALRWTLNPPGGRVVFENRDDLAGAVADRLVRPAAAVLIRGAGVDVRAFRPARAPVPGQPRVVLVARMLWEKGIGDYVAAARLLRQHGSRARCLLIGAPDPGNPGAIPEARLRAWHAEGAVEWLGPRTDIPALLAQARIACLPSYREGLPKSLLEAMAAGLPIVTTDVPGCREAVQHGENGLLVPPRDPEALARALARLLADTPLCQRLGAAGRQRAEREFASERVCAATLELYARHR